MLHLDEGNFDTEVNSRKIIVIDFWAPWCGPCRALGPIIEQIANEVSGDIAVAKINIDECPGLAERFQVQSIPTVVFLKDGQEVNRSVGLSTKADLLSVINSL
ncbi:MAG: thioredoxin [Opitutales bacterium]|nr:thioredoxin [Opitutales bacterium]